MHVLIVDDEYFACAALEKLVKDYFKEHSLPLSCKVFEDSRNALQYLNENQVDLVLTDIRMSELDGLELALKIQQLNHHTETVVISGYAEFTYAQTALRYHVADYLLKPISRSQIYACLNERVKSYARNCEEQSRAQRQQKHAIFHQISSSRELTAGQLLTPAEKEQYDQVVMVMVRIKETSPQIHGFISALLNLKGVRARDFENLTGNVVLILCYGAGKESRELRERVIRHCGMCCKKILPGMAGGLSLSVSGAAPLPAPLIDLYQQSKYALNNRLLDPDAVLFDYHRTIGNKGYDGTAIAVLEHELKQSIEFKDIALTKNLISRQLQAVADSGHPSVSQLWDVTAAIVVIMNKIINTYNYKTQKAMEDIPAIKLSQFHTLNELKEYFYQHIERIYNEVFQADPGENIVDRLLEYVKENYYLNISMAEISRDILFLNQSYVSRLFKARMDISFSKYLLNYRLEKAMECISGNPDISIQEAAGLTGFSDCSYFVKQFKKQYGETPGYYQKCAKNTTKY